MSRIIAGALFDFMGFLTTRQASTSFGSRELASPAVDLLKEWADTRGLHLDDADVTGWQAALSQREAEPVASSQDVEEFIAEKQRHNTSLNHNAIHADDLRAWMAGHARVPVEPTYDDMQSMIDAGIKSTSAKVTRNECLMIYAAMLTRQCNLITASKEKAPIVDICGECELPVGTTTGCYCVTCGRTHNE